jgi:hypothetical protein
VLPQLLLWRYKYLKADCICFSQGNWESEALERRRSRLISTKRCAGTSLDDASASPPWHEILNSASISETSFELLQKKFTLEKLSMTLLEGLRCRRAIERHEDGVADLVPGLTKTNERPVSKEKRNAKWLAAKVSCQSLS